MKKVCALFGIMLAIVATGIMVNVKQKRMQEELASQVLRFHVLANSDSEEDQNLKMKVKEQVIAYMKRELPQSDSLETTKLWAKTHLEEIETVSKQVIRKEGYLYSVKAEVTNSSFPDKSYGDVTFPAGEYEALRIEIGEAKGQNWWCVLYPNLCFIDSVHAVVPKEGKQDLKRVLDEETYEMVTATTRFKIGWFFF